MIVNVPVDGGFANEILPLNAYRLPEHAVGVAVIPDIEQLQDAGAVKFCVSVQLGVAENVADTVHPAPFAGNPDNE